MKVKGKAPKLNILDISIIIIILLTVISAFYRHNTQRVKLITKEYNDVVVTVVAKDSEQALYNSIKVGDKIKIDDSGESFGTVKTIVQRNTKQYVPDEAGGTMTQLFSDDKGEVVIQVDTKCKKGEEGNFINGNIYVSKGSEFSLKTNTSRLEAQVIDVSE